MGLLAIGRKMLEKIKNYFYIASICLTAIGTITGGILYLSRAEAQEIVKRELVKPLEKLEQELKEQQRQLNQRRQHEEYLLCTFFLGWWRGECCS